MVRKALALLVGIAVLGVALGIVGLLWPGIADAQTPGATRTILPTMVAPGGEVVVTITTSGFTNGGVEETLPDGFEYKTGSVSSNSVLVRMLDSGAIGFAMTGVTEFSYTATVAATAPAGGYGDAFSGVLIYVDTSTSDRERVPMDDTPVTVGTTPTPVTPDDMEEMPEMPEPAGPSATRRIVPTMVAPGGEVVVTITTMGFTAGGVEETMPAGFRYKMDSVSPSEVGAMEVNGGAVVRFAMTGVTEFSYTVMVAETEPRNGYGDAFSGFLRYLNETNDPMTVDIEDTPVMVGDGTTPMPMPMPDGPGASRTVTPATVAPGGEVVVMITASGFTAGGIVETLPSGFTYKPDSVSPSDINAMVLDSGAVRFVMTGVTEFSYTAMVDDMAAAGSRSFSGVLTYLDSSNDRQTMTMANTAVMVSGPGATRAIDPARVAPGGEIVVTMTTMGFTAGGIVETLPNGFTYKEDSVDPSDVNVMVLDSGAVRFVMTGVSEFSYTVVAPRTVGGYSFSGQLVYVDASSDRQTVTVMGDTQVTVRVLATIAPTPTTRPPSRRGGGGGGGSGAYPPPIATATPMPTRAPVATIAPTPTPIIVPTIVAPTVAPTPEPTAKPEPTAVPPTAVPTPRPTAIVMVPTVAPTKPPEPTATPKPTEVPPTAVPPTEVPPTVVPPTEPPAPTATIAPTVAPVTPVTPDEVGMPTWLIILIIVVIVAVVIAAVGFYMMRMRR